jgi:hypothetical protein
MSSSRPLSSGTALPQRDAASQRRWVWRISRDQERRLYFLATVVLAAWALLARLL